MTEPRYIPASYCHDPTSFGRAEALAWVRPDTGDLTETEARQATARFEASRLQHEVALQIRRLANRRHGSVAAYARLLGQTPDRLAKVLRGAQPMRLEDVTAAVVHLDMGWPLTTERARPRPQGATRWLIEPEPPPTPPTTRP